MQHRIGFLAVAGDQCIAVSAITTMVYGHRRTRIEVSASDMLSEDAAKEQPQEHPAEGASRDENRCQVRPQ